MTRRYGAGSAKTRIDADAPGRRDRKPCCADGARLVIPAELSAVQTVQFQQLAVRVFQAIDGAGLGRVDFFLEKETNEIFVNEINTMPGFTSISMYPKLWEASGLSYSALIDRLIELALERHQEKSRNVTSYS